MRKGGTCVAKNKKVRYLHLAQDEWERHISIFYRLIRLSISQIPLRNNMIIYSYFSSLKEKKNGPQNRGENRRYHVWHFCFKVINDLLDFWLSLDLDEQCKLIKRILSTHRSFLTSCRGWTAAHGFESVIQITGMYTGLWQYFDLSY